MNIILIGFKKAGKTTIGQLLSSLLKKRFIDMDDVIKKKFSDMYYSERNIFEIYNFLNEKKFRNLENTCYKEIREIDDAVIATSGGCILNKNNLKILSKKKIIIYLKSSKEILVEKIKKGEKSIFLNNDFFEKVYDQRKILYENAADWIIEINNLNFGDIAMQIKEKLNVE